MVIKNNGVVRVQGRCGNTRDTNVSSLAPCHLPHLDGTIDPSLAIISPDLACEVCNFPDDEEFMLLCDYCNLGWHMYCLEPPLTVLPPAKDAWLCPTCLAAGVTLTQLKDVVRDRSKSHVVAPAQELSDSLFKRRTAVADKNAASRDGLLVRRVSTTKAGTELFKWGAVKFRGAEAGPMYFEVLYDDGSSELADLRGLRALRPFPKGTVRPSAIMDLHTPTTSPTIGKGGSHRKQPCM